MYQNRWLVIGISGVTCGGKSTLATALYNYFINNKNRPIFNSNIIVEEAALISQDNYFLPKDDTRHQLIKNLNHINWEILTSLDMEKMINDINNIFIDDTSQNNDNIMSICNNSNINNITTTNISSSFHYNNHHRHQNILQYLQQQNQHHEIKRIKILIIEGFLIFNHPQILQLCQIKFHLHLPYEKCYERRIKRIYDPPDVTGYFEMCVWPMYEKHFDEFKDYDDIYMLNGETPKEKIFKYVLNCISNYCNEL